MVPAIINILILFGLSRSVPNFTKTQIWKVRRIGVKIKFSFHSFILLQILLSHDLSHGNHFTIDIGSGEFGIDSFRVQDLKFRNGQFACYDVGSWPNSDSRFFRFVSIVSNFVGGKKVLFFWLFIRFHSQSEDLRNHTKN